MVTVATFNGVEIGEVVDFLLCEQAVYDREHLREPLKRYIQKSFAEYDPDQMLMFGLSNDELMKGLLDKILNIEINFGFTIDSKARPSAVFYAKNFIINVYDVDSNRYDPASEYLASYTSYVDSVIFHELIHAVDYVMNLYKDVSYDMIDPKYSEYYGDPEEMRAYHGQMKVLLQDYFGISPGRVRQLMRRWTTDKSSGREDWINYIQSGEWKKYG